MNDLIRPNPEIEGPGIGPDGYPGTAFPYLSTNLDFSGEPDLAELVVEPGEAPQPNSITDSVVIEVGGEPIGIVGATTPSLPSISSIGNITVTPIDDTDIEALAAEIQETVDALTATGINKVILLAHMQQIAIEEELAGLLSDVDVIMGNDTIYGGSADRETSLYNKVVFNCTLAGGGPWFHGLNDLEPVSWVAGKNETALVAS